MFDKDQALSLLSEALAELAKAKETLASIKKEDGEITKLRAKKNATKNALETVEASLTNVRDIVSAAVLEPPEPAVSPEPGDPAVPPEATEPAESPEPTEPPGETEPPEPVEAPVEPDVLTEPEVLGEQDATAPVEPPAADLPDWPAWWAVLNTTAKAGVQIARPGENQPPYQGAQWAVNDHDIVGVGDTIALAFENYKKKGGKFFDPGPAPAPSTAQRQALETFLGLRRLPTSLRRSGNGVYFCDYFRSQELHDKTAGHSTPEEAVAALRAVLGDQL